LRWGTARWNPSPERKGARRWEPGTGGQAPTVTPVVLSSSASHAGSLGPATSGHLGTKLVAQTFLLGLLACDARYPSWAPKTLGISGGRNPGFRTSSGISTKRHASPSACTMYVVLDGTRGVHDPTPFLSYLACADRSAESAGLRLVRLWSFPLTTVHAVTGLMRGHADGLRPVLAQPPTQDGHRRQGVTVLELFRVPICADMHRDCHSRVTSALASSSASSVASGKGLDVAALVIVS